MKKYLFLFIAALVCAVQMAIAQTQVNTLQKRKELPMPFPDKLVKPASTVIIPAHIPEIKKPSVASLPNLQDHIDNYLARCPSHKSPGQTIVLNAERANNLEANLKWETKYAFKASGFNIERSLADTFHFQNINFELAKPGTSIKKNYQLPDRNDYNGISFYRIKQINNGNDYIYSNIVSVKGYQAVGLRIYPNPSSAGISVEMLATQTGDIVIAIYDPSGKIMQRQVLNGTKDVMIVKAFDVSKFTPGAYQVKIIMPDNTFLSGKFIKE